MKTKQLFEKPVLPSIDIGPDEEPAFIVYGVTVIDSKGNNHLVGELPVIFDKKQADRLVRELVKLTSSNKFMSAELRLFSPIDQKSEVKPKEKAKKTLTPAKKSRTRKG